MEHYRLNIEIEDELIINDLHYAWDKITNIECNVVYNDTRKICVEEDIDVNPYKGFMGYLLADENPIGLLAGFKDKSKYKKIITKRVELVLSFNKSKKIFIVGIFKNEDANQVVKETLEIIKEIKEHWEMFNM